VRDLFSTIHRHFVTSGKDVRNRLIGKPNSQRRRDHAVAHHHAQISMMTAQIFQPPSKFSFHANRRCTVDAMQQGCTILHFHEESKRRVTLATAERSALGSGQLRGSQEETTR
jgi:hypothetical protein